MAETAGVVMVEPAVVHRFSTTALPRAHLVRSAAPAEPVDPAVATAATAAALRPWGAEMSSAPTVQPGQTAHPEVTVERAAQQQQPGSELLHRVTEDGAEMAPAVPVVTAAPAVPPPPRILLQRSRRGEAEADKAALAPLAAMAVSAVTPPHLEPGALSVAQAEPAGLRLAVARAETAATVDLRPPTAAAAPTVPTVEMAPAEQYPAVVVDRVATPMHTARELLTPAMAGAVDRPIRMERVVQAVPVATHLAPTETHMPETEATVVQPMSTDKVAGAARAAIPLARPATR